MRVRFRALLVIFTPVGQLREGVVERDFRGLLRLFLIVAPLLIFRLIGPAVLLAILTAIRSALLIRLRRLFGRLFAMLFAGAGGVTLHRQCNLVLLQIHFKHSHRDAVAGADHVARVLDEAVAEPRYVNESVLMHADVYERPEVGHVGDDARTGHSRLQVFDLVNVFAVGEGRELITRVAARFGKFGDYVREREFADIRFELFGLFDQLNAGAGQLGHALAQPGGQRFERRVAFGMHSGVVEGVPGVRDAQEAGGLLEHLFAEPRDVE